MTGEAVEHPGSQQVDQQTKQDFVDRRQNVHDFFHGDLRNDVHHGKADDIPENLPAKIRCAGVVANQVECVKEGKAAGQKEYEQNEQETKICLIHFLSDLNVLFHECPPFSVRRQPADF